jgi:pilus assembly protein CpaE
MMGRTIAFVSVKGGVGKTTLALETASALANDFGKRVLLVDGNFSAPNVGLYLDLTSEYTLHDALYGEALHNAIYEAHGFDVIPASMEFHSEVDIFKLKKILAKFKPRYDFIIIDSSPNYEEMKPVVAAADEIFVVTTPDHVTLGTSLKASKVAMEQNTPISGIVINKINHPKYEMSLPEVEEVMDVPVVAKINHDKRFTEAMYYNQPMNVYKNRGGVSEEVKKFASAICGQPEQLGGIFSRLFPFNKLVGKESVNREFLRKSFYE